MDLRDMTRLNLTQLTDNQTYSSTMAALERCEPVEIILSQSLEGRVLFRMVHAAWDGSVCSVSVLHRKRESRDGRPL